MNIAETQIFISTIGWALFHFLWQGTLITFLYWLITRTTQSLQVKYWTGMSLVIISLIVPIYNSYQSQGLISTASTIGTLPALVISYQQISTENLFLHLIDVCLPYFVMIWAATVLFLSMRLIKSWLSLAAINHDCEPQVSSRLKQYIKTFAIKLDLPIIPALKVSKSVVVPAAYGLFKPTVLLPLSLISQIPQDQLEAIIKHELCHLKRNDFIHNILQLCADILLFFHPGIRWMNNDIRHIREQCCDQMVLSHQTEALTYAKALTNIAAYTNGMKQTQSIHLGINDGILLNRVKYLLQVKSSQPSLFIFMPILLLIVFAIFLINHQSTDNQTIITMDSNSSFNQGVDTVRSNEPLTKRIMSSSFYPSRKNKFDSISPAPATKSANQIKKPAMTNTLNNNLTIIQSDLNLRQAAQFEPNPIQRTEISAIKSLPINRPEQITADILGVARLTDLDQPKVSIDLQTNYSSTAQELTTFDENNSLMPKLKRYLQPSYPDNFGYNQVEQDVIATFKINPDGRTYDIEVNSLKNNYIDFEQEVVKALKKWQFETHSLNQATLQRTFQQVFSFSLTDQVIKKCEFTSTGSRLKKLMPCNK